ncbi:hypothetical protein CF326_g8519 [Tilletia indica]|nr:hypothetical protein CF326_g8519 [Tilletia indica]
MTSRRQNSDTPTRDEFSALDSARAKLDDDVALVRRSVESHSTDINELKAGMNTVRSDMSSLHNKVDQLLASLTPLPPSHSTSSSAPSASSSVAADQSASSQQIPAERWDSQAAAFPGGRTPQIRFQSAVATDGEETGRSFTIKPEELGTFEGVPEDAALFLANVEAIRSTERDPGWDKAILRALPRTLRGPARLWFASLSTLERSTSLSSLDALLAAIRANFKPPQAIVRHQARTRRWQPDDEDAIHYSFVKAALLKTGWPSMTETDLVNDIVEGIDPVVAKLLQTPFRRDPTLRAGVPAFESLVKPTPTHSGSAFVAQHGGADALSSTDVYPQASQSFKPNSNSITRPPNPRQGRSIRSDFDPANLSYRIHPELNKRMMSYKVPLTNRIMWCTRPCDHCGGEHFGFAHEHCSKHTVPTVLAVEADEDYPTTEDAGF